MTSQLAINDIPMVLHDLIRARFITSSVIKEFDLSETHNKVSTLSAGDLKPLGGAFAGKQHQMDAKLSKDVCTAALHVSSTTGK